MLIPVELEGRGYPIHIVDGGLDGLGAAVAEALPPGPVVIVSNDVVGPLYMAEAGASLERAGFRCEKVLVPDGEVNKTLAIWAELVESILAAGLRRSTPILALGGGVVGDMAGFAAASALRGVPFVQVPTTLLAMVDSAVGGKTGINSRLGKNLVGAFYQPRLVYAAMGTLKTLDDAELRSGLGEVLKHGILQDPALFALCEDQAARATARDPAVLGEMVERSCRVKAAVVAQDEREDGLRAILNLGHTVGHAIETAAGHGQLRHGECVAMGLAAECAWAAARGSCPPELPDRVRDALRGLGLPTRPPALSLHDLERAAGYDKKLAHAKLTTAVVERIGAVHLESVGVQEIPRMLSHLT